MIIILQEENLAEFQENNVEEFVEADDVEQIIDVAAGEAPMEDDDMKGEHTADNGTIAI